MPAIRRSVSGLWQMISKADLPMNERPRMHHLGIDSRRLLRNAPIAPLGTPPKYTASGTGFGAGAVDVPIGGRFCRGTGVKPCCLRAACDLRTLSLTVSGRLSMFGDRTISAQDMGPERGAGAGADAVV